ncbi:glycosyltransferase family 4 protein [Sneathiella chinensis]|uniref:glycosyltransferase family 4 protein n=1 Tax=Sneathiella chinensis TaxID=349750 RepID=UPI0019CFF281|nr:glycosyltransferase family 4 protein [Sneathiella chinensis]
MARLISAALEEAGFDVELASELRTFDRQGDGAFQQAIREKSRIEAERLIARWSGAGAADRPGAWFTYHLYHKAPDWIGPAVAAALDIPYLVAEASDAPKQENGPWHLNYEAARSALLQASRVFHMTRHDRACLEPVVGADAGKLVFLPPFLGTETGDEGGPDLQRDGVKPAAGRFDPARKTLLSVAMMRPGDKMVSYQQLAESLQLLDRTDWQILIIGDGEKEQEVRTLFEPVRDHVVWIGKVERNLSAWYRLADLYVWPAHGEAYGMAFLEAQRQGLPVVAGAIRGVPDVVKGGETGLLTPPGDLPAFAAAISRMLSDDALRTRMGQAARRFVREERTIQQAAYLLKTEITEVLS